MPRFSPRQTHFTPFEGGWDTQTPPLFLERGYARSTQNFECGILRGYALVQGNERRDGRSAPSDAAYSVLRATITGSYSVGNSLSGSSSGAHGTIAAVASGYFVLTEVSGTFTSGENLGIGTLDSSGNPLYIAVATDTQISGGASTTRLDAQYLAAAANIYRTRIQAVPGSGSVRGVWYYNNVLYAFRDNELGNAGGMFKESSVGWVPIALGLELSFNTGTVQVRDGQTITGVISGATAVVERVLLQTGDWLAGSAAGRFIMASQTGSFTAENVTVGTTTVASLTGDSTAITLLPGGRYEFENANFGGSSNTKRMYGVDGVNRGFEFDGTTFVPITTGMSPDQPDFLTIHKNHLFFAFGGSVQHSGIAKPYNWTIIQGAGELAQGDDVTSFKKQTGSSDGGALLISTRNRLNILYGTSVLNWNLVNYAEEQGAFPHTTQRIGTTVMLDDRGVTTLQTAVEYGNFQNATISQRIQSWINSQKTKAVASCVCRDKNQYRLFFSDGYALYVTFTGTKLRGMMPVLFPHPVTCAASGESNAGTELMFFGSSDGYVRQMDKGTSFDGEDIEFILDLAFDNQKSPRSLKHYKHAQFEIQGGGFAEFDVSYELGYNSTNLAQPGNTTLSSEFSAPFWDSFTWDEFTWDGVTLLPSNMPLSGSAENISLKIKGVSDYISAFTLSGVLLDFTLRRSLR